MDNRKNILLTGGAGFIGSNFVNKICTREKDYSFLVLDSLTYAGDLNRIKKNLEQNDNISFVEGDIRDESLLSKLFKEHQFEGILNFAAESHVDNSIKNPTKFIETNVLGTLSLLNCAKESENCRFLQVSTDEVYGSLSEEDGPFTESNDLKPNSPYSASKASADLLVRSYNETYGMDTIVTRCSNNYGPNQLKEKLIPLMITYALKNKKLPVYGDGKNIRDWIHVDDHNNGVWSAFKKGQSGEVYNLGGNCEKRNIEIVKIILDHLKIDHNLISYVEDRLGHDWRYSIDYKKAKLNLGWQPEVSFEKGIIDTIEWYKEKSK